MNPYVDFNESTTIIYIHIFPQNTKEKETQPVWQNERKQEKQHKYRNKKRNGDQEKQATL